MNLGIHDFKIKNLNMKKTEKMFSKLNKYQHTIVLKYNLIPFHIKDFTLEFEDLL